MYLVRVSSMKQTKQVRGPKSTTAKAGVHSKKEMVVSTLLRLSQLYLNVAMSLPH